MQKTEHQRVLLRHWLWSRRLTWTVAGGALLAAALLLVACGDDDDDETPPAPSAAPTAGEPTPAQEPAAAIDYDSLGGRIEIDGSSTVFPITEAVAEEFQLVAGKVQTTVGISGTGGGFSRFCAGETDISDASRPIKAEELAECEQNGIAFVEIPVAFDGLTVVVNPENDWVDSLTVEELNHIWRPDDPAQTWADVRAGWPDNEIVLFGPGTDSGTFDYFTETINGEVGAIRPDFTASEDDNVLVIGVEGEKNALGYFGLSYFVNNAERLKAVPINGGDGPVSPSDETVNNGTYTPLSRPLFIYVRIDSLAKPEVRAFVEFYLGDTGRALVSTPEVGYVQLPAELYTLAQERVAKGIAGSVYHDESLGLDPKTTPILDLYKTSAAAA